MHYNLFILAFLSACTIIHYLQAICYLHSPPSLRTGFLLSACTIYLHVGFLLPACTTFSSCWLSVACMHHYLFRLASVACRHYCLFMPAFFVYWNYILSLKPGFLLPACATIDLGWLSAASMLHHFFPLAFYCLLACMHCRLLRLPFCCLHALSSLKAAFLLPACSTAVSMLTWLPPWPTCFGLSYITNLPTW